MYRNAKPSLEISLRVRTAVLCGGRWFNWRYWVSLVLGNCHICDLSSSSKSWHKTF